MDQGCFILIMLLQVGAGFYIYLLVEGIAASKKRAFEERRKEALEAEQRILQEKEASKKAEEERKQKVQEEMRRAEENRRRAYLRNQEDLYRKTLALSQKAMKDLEELPGHLREAKSSMVKAEEEYVGKYFIPFWDAVEKAAMAMGRFDDCLHEIKGSGGYYKSLLKEYDGKPPAFPSMDGFGKNLEASKLLASRLRKVVRKAYQDPDFTSAFLNRQTNQILIAGFEKLGDALDNMHDRLASSLSDLAFSVDSVGKAIEESSQSASRELETLSSIQQENQRWKWDLDRRSEKVLDVLEGIQRGD